MVSHGSLERLRAANRRALVSLLSGEGPMSRADLARGTGLSRTTVSTLVGELIDSGHVTETAVRGRPHKGGSGRPPLLVAVTVPPGTVAGIDVGHRHVRVALADRAGTVLTERCETLDVDGDGAATLDRVTELVRTLLAEQGSSPAELHGAAMCVPGPLDRRSARVGTGILPGWRDLPPAEELRRRLGVPLVVADNDANLGALAELGRGAARGVSDLVYVKVASGLGAGIVLGGRLHRGSTGIAGELGHVQIGPGDGGGELCRCGNRGCLETLAAAPRVLAELQPAYDEPLTEERLLALDAAGDADAGRALEEAGRAVGRALADLCNNLNPERIVLGGSLGTSASLGDGVRAALGRYAQPDAAAAVKVVPGELGDRAEVLGAVTLAVNRVAATL